MGTYHGVIDFGGRPEVIRRDHQALQLQLGVSSPPLQAASRRERRNWKNSTPSRKRRFIISGLAIISATIDAIFDGRK
jgi:hypothetical protein